jgi:hypothetical protein
MYLMVKEFTDFITPHCLTSMFTKAAEGWTIPSSTVGRVEKFFSFAKCPNWL